MPTKVHFGYFASQFHFSTSEKRLIFCEL